MDRFQTLLSISPCAATTWEKPADKYTAGTLSGSVSVGVDALTVSATVGFDTRESWGNWAYAASVVYKSRWVTLDLHAENAPSASAEADCMDWIINGTVSLAMSDVKMALEANGTYLCAPDAERDEYAWYGGAG